MSRVELVTKIETAVHVPAHYLLMILSALLALLVLIITRRVFATVVVVVPTVFFFCKDIHEQKDLKKWLYYWMFFSLLTVFTGFLSHIFYFDIVKIAICYYFAFFDKECYLEKGFTYVADGLAAAIEKYKGMCNVKSE